MAFKILKHNLSKPSILSALGVVLLKIARKSENEKTQ